MPKNERNMLSMGAESLIKRNSDEVRLVKKAGRPSAGSPQTSWDKKRNLTTSMVMDREQHNQIKRLANKTGNTFKQVMYLLLQEGLNRYEAGDMVIHNPMDEDN